MSENDQNKETLKDVINEKVEQPEEPKQNIKVSEKLGFMGFSTASNIVFNFKSLFYLFFLTEILGLEPWAAGLITIIGTIWDAVNDPLIAVFCANHKFKNGERIRPYALWMCIPWAITVVLLFVNFNVTQNWAIVICILVYLLFETFYTFLCMPYNSMGSLATKNDKERKSINAFRSLGTCLGSGIGALAITPLVKLFGGMKELDPETGKNVIGKSDSLPILYTALVMAALCIIGSLWHYFTTKERVKPENETKDKEKVGFIEAYKYLFKCKSWRWNLFYVCCYASITGFVLNTVNYYAKYVIGNSDMSTIILAFYLVIAIVTSLLTPLLDKKLGRRKLCFLSIIILACLQIPFVIISFIPNIPSALRVVAMSINSAGCGFGLTACFIIFNVNRNNLADLIEVQCGKRMDTMVSGGDNLFNKLANAAVLGIISLVFQYNDYSSDVGKLSICLFLGLIPLILNLLMLIPTFKINIPKELKEAQLNNNKFESTPNENS